MYKQNQTLVGLIEPVATAMGYELLGIEYMRQGRDSLLRIYIDKVGGIALADCEAVSRQVTGVLDVEDPIQGAYHLEVSSPGLDRPLFTLRQFEKFKGHVARVNLGTKLDGRRKLTGTITATGMDFVEMNVDGREFKVPAAFIEQARLVPGPADFNLAQRREKINE
jgi:ribosome maturation factor RimP